MHYLKKYHKTIGTIILITILSLINTSKLTPIRLPLIPHMDKIVHFGMYFTLAFVFMFEYYLYHHKQLTRMYKIIVLPLLYGALMEVLQRLITSYRSGDWWDMLANACRIFSAYAGVYLLRNNQLIHKWMLYPFKQQ